jgi:hypothetical protein
MPKPALVVASPATMPRSEARRALSAAIDHRVDANAAMQGTTAALTAVSGLVDGERTARAKLDEANARAADAIAAWAKEGATGTPVKCGDDLTALLREVEEATVTATAARASLPRLQAEHEAARAVVATARDAIHDAIQSVLAEEAAAIDGEIAALHDRLLVLRTRLYGLGRHAERMPNSRKLVATLTRMCERFAPDPADAATLANQPRWRELAERLSTDPDATIEAE